MTDIPEVKLKAFTVFPSQVQAESPVLLDKTAGVYTISLDEDQLRTDIGAPSIQDITDATVAAAASAASAAASAAALGNQVHQYDTRAQAIAATIPAGVNLVSLLGRNTAGDLGGGLYKKLGGAPIPVASWHWQNTAAGTWWQLVEEDVNPRMFGTAGDGATDDFAAFQDACSYVDQILGGGSVNGIGTDTYKFIISAGTANLGVSLPAGVDLVGNGAAIRFYCDGHCYGIRPLGSNKIFGWDMKVASSTGLSATPGAEQAIWHACIALGAAYGAAGTVASPSAYISASDIEIAHNTFDSVRNNGQGSLIHGLTGGKNINIHDNVVPDNATICIAFGFDWVFVGPLDETNFAQAKTDYTNNLLRTRHPAAITIKNNRIGHLTMPVTTSGGFAVFGSHGIRMSGCMSFDISDNDIEETTFAGVYQTGGDVGFEYSDPAERYLAYRDCKINGNRIKQANGGYSVYADCFPDNIYDAATNAANPQYPYAVMYAQIYPTNIEIKGNFCNGNGASSALEGIKLNYMDGGIVAGNITQFHKNGIRVTDGCSNVSVVQDNYITNNREAGILCGGTTVLPKTTIIDDNKVFGNYTASTGAAGNICVDSSQRTTVTRNQIGENETTATIGINNTANAAYSTILNNHVYAVKAGGTAYQLGGVSNTIWEFRGNQYDGADTYVAGLDIIPERRRGTTGGGKMVTHYLVKQSAMSGNKPNTGAFVIGDTLEVPDAVNTSDVYASKCTVAGSQGTWKTTVTLP